MMRNRVARWCCWFVAAAILAACQNDTLMVIPPSGTVEGYLCDPNTDELAAAATVSGTGIRGVVSTTTNDRGFFTLDELGIGPQTLTVEGAGFTDTVSVDVVAQTKTRLTDPPCLTPPVGSVDGRICAVESQIGSGAGYYLANATVTITVGTDTFMATTDAGGHFALTGVPSGTRTLTVTKGSFTASVEVVIHPEQTTTLDYVCVESGARLAVVTGIFDSVQKVLEDLGFTVRDCQAPGLDPGCATADATNGNISIFNGENVSAYVVLFNDSFVLGQYDIVFLNCGFSEDYILTEQIARDNLRDFVNGGGSLYVSDFAYPVIRDIFQLAGTPVLSFYGDGSVDAAKHGVSNLAQPGTVVDATLETLVGTNVSLAYDKQDWAALTVNQPAAVQVFITGDPKVDPDGVGGTAPETLTGAPLLVSVPYGAGRIVYTTFHVTRQPTAETMRDILRYIVFEL